jgi:hypothetical protein
VILLYVIFIHALIHILLQASLRIPSTALDIVWLNGQYWILEDKPELFVSLNVVPFEPVENQRAPYRSSGKAARLRSVCWLDVRSHFRNSTLFSLRYSALTFIIQVTGVLRSVPCGYYKVRWHLAFDEDAYGLDDVLFVAMVSGLVRFRYGMFPTLIILFVRPDQWTPTRISS